MKNAVIVIILMVLGAGGAYVYLKSGRETNQVHAEDSNRHESRLGTSEHVKDAVAGADLLHGASANAMARRRCATHSIPDEICAFCHPELIEKLGFCTGHDVPEAFCTRCSPILIAAFKAEGDWCAEHDLPESQCKLCKG